MFFQLLRFELLYQRRQLSWWFALVIFSLLGAFLSGRVVASGNVAFLSPHNIAYAVAFISHLAIFTTTIITSNSMLKDKVFNFEEIVNTKPLTTWYLRGVRFVGLYIMSLAIVLVAISLMFLPSLFLESEHTHYGNFSIRYLLWPVIILVLPNVFITASLLFFSASIFRSFIATLMAGVGVYVLYVVTTSQLDSPIFTASSDITSNQLSLVSLLDPFGISAYLEQVQYWTSEEKNTKLVSFSDSMLMNRVLWLVISMLLLINAFTRREKPYSLFKRKNDKPKISRKKLKDYSAYSTTSVKQTHQSSDWWLALITHFKMESKLTIRGVPFFVLSLFIVVLVLSQLVSAIQMGSLVGQQHPYTSLLLPHIVNGLKVIGILSIVFYSGEMIWRAKECQFQEIVSITPVPKWSFLIGQIAVLTVLIFFMLMLAIVTAIGYQLWRQFYAIDVVLYASLIPVYAFPTVFLGVLSLAIHLVSPNKYVGIVLSASLLLFFNTDISALAGIENHLLKFASVGSVKYSDFNGFGDFTNNIFWFQSYWFSVTMVLAIVAYGISKRKLGQSLLSAVASLPVYLSARTQRYLKISFALMVGTGSYIFYNTHIVNEYITNNDIEQFQVDYEKTFDHFKEVASPVIESIYSEVSFYPSEKKIDIRGHYWLENRTSEFIDTFLITLPSEDGEYQFEIDRPYSATENRKLNTVEVVFATPLAPNEKAKFTFDLVEQKRGFKNSNANIKILESGSYFHGASLLPYIGYNHDYEIKADKIRESYGLKERIALSEPTYGQDYHKHSLQNDADWINFEAIVSTEGEQTAIAPGELQRHWQQNNRSFYHYKTKRKVANFLAFASANYHIKTKQVGKIKVNAFYHPEHHKNIGSMLNTAEVALTYYQSTFGEYPYRELNLVEIPYRSFARAYPATIFISENVGYKEDLANDSDLDDFSNLIAHEIAHQWWGHQLIPAEAKGATLLTESLADYLALMVMKRVYSDKYAQQYVEKSTKKYLQARSADAFGEAPLTTMQGQHYLRYEKGTVVFHALQMLLGEKQLNQRLKALFSQKANIHSGYATTFDLISELKNNTSEQQATLVDEWLNNIMIYQLGIEQHHLSLLSNGKYQLTAAFSGEKSSEYTNSNTHLSPIEYNIPVFVLSEAGQVLAKESVRFHEGKGELTTQLSEKPHRLLLDPHHMFIEKNLRDNSVLLSVEN